MEDIENVVDDAREVFCFSREKRPQERAHDYLERRQIRRGYRDTAMELVAIDLVERAYDAGRGGVSADAMLDEVEYALNAAINAMREESDFAKGENPVTR